MEVALHFGDPFERLWPDGKWRRQASALFIGQMLSPAIVRPCGETGVLGVRFHPAGLHAFCPIPKQEFQNKIEQLDLVWPGIHSKLSEVATSPQRLQDLDAFLLASLRQQADTRIAAAVSAISGDPCVPIDLLISRTGMSSRTFRRKFSEQVGIGPKVFSRIIRFQNALQELQSSSPVEAALNSAYYDQSHMVHEFQQFAGCPPSVLLARNGQFLQDSRSQSVL